MEKLDLAIQDTVFNSDISAQQIAHKIGVGYQILLNKVNPTNEGNKLSLRETWALAHATENVGIFRIILEDLGYVMRRSEAEKPDTDILGAFLAIAVESGDVARVTKDALADGRISPREKSSIRREVEENIAALETLLKVIDTEF